MKKSYCNKGRYLNDVRTEGGGGVTQYVTNTTDRLRECVTKWGAQIPKILRTSFKYRP